MILALVAAFTVTFSPASPRVGDLVTVDFPAAVVLDPSPEYEVVTRAGRRVVVRTFTPKPFEMRGVAGGNVLFTKVMIPVKSVLRPNDDLAPAPLAPPVRAPQPQLPWIALATAAGCAIVAWALVWWRSRGARTVAPERVIAPEERFRLAVAALLQSPSEQGRWARLADETRLFLAATRPHLGIELTTTELLPRLGPDERVVAEILRQGDLEKFSPQRRGTGDFVSVAAAALGLVREQPAEEAAA